MVVFLTTPWEGQVKKKAIHFNDRCLIACFLQETVSLKAIPGKPKEAPEPDKKTKKEPASKEPAQRNKV